MALPTRARIAGILSIGLLMLSAPAALAGPGAAFQPDAQIRLSSGSYVGNNVIKSDAAEQAVTGTGVVGQTLTFFILIQNDGFLFPDTFTVKRFGAFDYRYKVRYYDAANNDVTGKVNTGTFTTPSLAASIGTYEMRATVKVRSQASACSQVTRLMTVSSVGDPSAKDAVRFTAALDTPGLNCPPFARDETNSIVENQVSIAGSVLANDTDPDGDPLHVFYPVVLPQYGFFTLDQNTGSYSYELFNTHPAVDALNDGQTLIEAITYQITDGSEVDNGVLRITIHGVTDVVDPCLAADC